MDEEIENRKSRKIVKKKKMKSQKLGLRKFLKGLFGFFVVKVVLMSTVIIYQSCNTEEGLPLVKQTKEEFRSSVQSARDHFSNVEVFSEKEVKTNSNLLHRGMDGSLTKVDLVIEEPSELVAVSDFSDLTFYMNEGMISLKNQDDTNDDGTSDILVEEDCINVDGEQVCLSVYIDESQVQETLDPAIEAAREYMRSKGFTDAEIDYEVETEWGGSEEHLVPFVMYLVEIGEEENSTAALEFKNVFFGSLHAQSTPELTADEIWDCAVDAVGLGFVSAVGGSGLKKAGIKMLTKSFTKLVAKFAGPIGAAIMVADFGFCLYGAAND